MYLTYDHFPLHDMSLLSFTISKSQIGVAFISHSFCATSTPPAVLFQLNNVLYTNMSNSMTCDARFHEACITVNVHKEHRFTLLPNKSPLLSSDKSISLHGSFYISRLIMIPNAE